MALDDNPNFDPNGPWVDGAEICHGGNASDQEKLIACVVSRWVNKWIKTNLVTTGQVKTGGGGRL